MTDAGNAVTAQAQSDKGEALHFYAEESRYRSVRIKIELILKSNTVRRILAVFFCLIQGDFVI